MSRKTVEEILLERALVTKEDIDRFKDESKKRGVDIGRMLVDAGIIDEEKYIKALSEVLGVPYIDLTNYLVDVDTLNLIPEGMARKYKVVPLFKIGNTLTVSMADPKDVMVIDILARKTGYDIEVVLSGENSIHSAIDRYYGITGSIDETIKDIGKDKKIESFSSEEEDLKKLVEMAGEAPIIKLVNLIIMRAVKDRASDIHIEPEKSSLKIRFRIDGVLQDIFNLPRHLSSPVIARIKVVAGMDISEKRKPQDGRFNVKIEQKDIDLRVSSFPTIYGENIVIRLLDRSSILLGLDKLGFSDEQRMQFEDLIKRPNGIILVTGPTGSGKTTTLYSALSAIDSEEKNIITVEDPVEYHLGRIRQSQVNPKAGLTFATGLRSILRQDPDVIMVGEIRDRETAEISIQAALAGRLVFTTLHTNDAPGALTRLIDMGIEPFLIASSVIGIVAQRLVRRICERCKESYTPSQELIKKLDMDILPETFYRGRGCNDCKDTGYKGRIGIFELLIINDEIRRLLVEKASSTEIKKYAVAMGMKTLKDDGLDKILKGLTTIEEVIKVTQKE